MIEHLRAYRALGWATIRVEPCGKSPLNLAVSWRERIDEPETFLAGENVGIRLGDPSGGLVDVDLDCAEAIALAPTFLPPTATFGRAGPTKTPAAVPGLEPGLRRHWLYQCPGARTRKPSRSHVELRSTGAQTVFPPSVHESGAPIAWVDGGHPSPVHESQLLAAVGRLAAATIIARAWAGLEGNRHDAVLALAGALWHEGWSLDDALALLMPAFELDGSRAPHREQGIRDTWDTHERPRYGWPTVEPLLGAPDAVALRRAIEMIETAPRAAAPDGMRPLTDLGNAERLVDDHGEDLRYVPGLGWLQWQGSHWQVGTEPVALAARTVRRLQRLGAEQGQPHVTKWGLQSESAGKLRAMIGLAADLPEIHTPADSLDVDPWLLCCPNGVVDLRTGQLYEHERGHLQTRCAGVPYDPQARPDRFVRFLGEIFCGDWDLVLYVCRFLGYALTGLTSEQVFGLWYGHGSNGKSTLIEIIRYVLGDYAQGLAPDLLVERRFGRSSNEASPDLARLRGVRFAAGVETKEGQRWNESLVKQLTGSDRIVARHLYREAIEFDPTWKIVLAVNHKPIVRGTDHGMWRRIHLVPFDARFEGTAVDRTLLHTLRGEAPGILALLVAQCLEWQRRGLDPPRRVLAEVDAYRTSQDVVGSFLDECCRLDVCAAVSKAKLYQAYKHWCSQGGEYLHGKHAFNNQLRDRGWTDEKRGGQWVWLGIDLDNSRFGVSL